MAGHGPQPKAPGRRARTNSDPIPLRVVTVEPTSQPELPEHPPGMLFVDGEMTFPEWPEQTVLWWRMWRDSPLAADFTPTDWSELLDTAVLHADFWSGNTKVAGELRLRVAKFGATPEDRARLRITFAQADEAEAKPARSSARERRKGVKPRAAG